MVTRDTAIAFLNTIIDPALQAIDLWSQAAAELLLGTALQESGLIHRRQIGGGPALGLLQIEPTTYQDIHQNYLRYPLRSTLLNRTLAVARRSEWPEAEWLVTHDHFSVAVARIKYLRVPHELPLAGDVDAMAWYWKGWYNAGGSGSADEYIANWHAVMGN